MSQELLDEGMFIPNKQVDKLPIPLLFSIAVLLGAEEKTSSGSPFSPSTVWKLPLELV